MAEITNLKQVKQGSPSGIDLDRWDCKIGGVRTCIWVNWHDDVITVHIGGKRTVKLSLDDYTAAESVDFKGWLEDVL